jgi:hypothetical protein
MLSEPTDALRDLRSGKFEVAGAGGQGADDHDEAVCAKRGRLINRTAVILQAPLKASFCRRRQIGREAIAHSDPRRRQVPPPRADASEAGACHLVDHAVDRRLVAERRGVDRTEV